MHCYKQPNSYFKLARATIINYTPIVLETKGKNA